MSISKEELRRNQVREVLDEFKNIRKIVFERQKQSVKQFDDNAKPKTMRDTEAEISVDKGLEQMKIVLNKKVQTLDYFISNINSFKGFDPKSTTKNERVRETLTSITNYGDVLTAYNNIVRAYTKQGLSDTSKMIIQTKFQEIDPELKALIFGMNEVLNYLFGSEGISSVVNRIDKSVFGILHSLSVYRCIADQLKVNNYKVIENIDMETSFKQILSEQSETRRKLIMQYQKLNPSVAFDRSVALRNYPVIGDVKSRLDALESELGIKIPNRRQLEDDLKDVSGADVEKVLDGFRYGEKLLIKAKEVRKINAQRLNQIRLNEIDKADIELKLAELEKAPPIENLAEVEQEIDDLRAALVKEYKKVKRLNAELQKYTKKLDDLNKDANSDVKEIEQCVDALAKINNRLTERKEIIDDTELDIEHNLELIAEGGELDEKSIREAKNTIARLEDIVVSLNNLNARDDTEMVSSLDNLDNMIIQLQNNKQSFNPEKEKKKKKKEEKKEEKTGSGKSKSGRGRHIISDDEDEGVAGDESGDNMSDEEREELADDFIMEELKGTGKQIIYNDSRDDFYKVRKYNKH